MITPVSAYNASSFRGFEVIPVSQSPNKESRDEVMKNFAAEGLSKVLEAAKDLYSSDNSVYIAQIPDTGNEATFCIKTDEKTLEEVLSVSVKKSDLDRTIFKILKEGTLREIEEYIKEADTKDLGREIDSLSKTIDSFYFGTYFYRPIFTIGIPQETDKSSDIEPDEFPVYNDFSEEEQY